LTAPPTTIRITASGSPTIGQSFTLTCYFDSPPSLDPTPLSYLWKKNGTKIVGEANNQLITDPIEISDNNTMYTCQSNLSSPYLINPIQNTSEVFQLIIASND